MPLASVFYKMVQLAWYEAYYLGHLLSTLLLLSFFWQLLASHLYLKILLPPTDIQSIPPFCFFSLLQKHFLKCRSCGLFAWICQFTPHLLSQLTDEPFYFYNCALWGKSIEKGTKKVKSIEKGTQISQKFSEELLSPWHYKGMFSALRRNFYPQFREENLFYCAKSGRNL